MRNPDDFLPGGVPKLPELPKIYIKTIAILVGGILLSVALNEAAMPIPIFKES